MHLVRVSRRVVTALVPLALSVAAGMLAWRAHAGTDAVPVPHRISLAPDTTGYRRVIGPPDSYALRSGLVTLKPGASVGRHDTESYEEMLIVLSGHGRMTLDDRTTIELGPDVAAYCPPHTSHDVTCGGDVPLRYVYVVAKTSR